MAKQREVKQWITVNGKHVPIFEGESKADAVKRAVGKNNSTDTEKKSAGQKEEKPDWIADWDPIPDDPKEERKKRLAREKADEDDAYDKEHGEGKYAKKETVEDKKKAQKDKFFNDPYMQKAMKKAGVTREDWESGKVSDSQKYNISNEAYKMEDRAEKRAAKKAQSKKQEDGSNGKSEFGKETNDKISNYQDKFLKGKSDKQIQEIKDNLEKSGKIVGTSEQDHIALAAIRKEQEARKSSTKSSKDNDDHYATKLNDIRERMRSGKITPDQAKDEAFEYEKSQRTNKKWNDVDRNRMESKMRDIFDEADKEPVKKSSIQKQISKDLDTKEKQIAQHQAEADKLNGKEATRKPGEKYKSDAYEEGKEYMIRNFNGRKTPIKATYLESYVGKGESKMFPGLDLGDAHYFLGSDGVRYVLRDSELRDGDYSVTKKGSRATKATTMTDLKKQALAAGYSKEKIQGMTKAQLKKLLG